MSILRRTCLKEVLMRYSINNYDLIINQSIIDRSQSCQLVSSAKATAVWSSLQMDMSSCPSSAESSDEGLSTLVP